MILDNCLFYILLAFSSEYVAGSALSSLTFVIDDTSSMGDDIVQVRASVRDIFATVLRNKNESQIDNFILVTFNDRGPGNEYGCTNPDVQLRAKTKDQYSFSRALDVIDPNNGEPDCAECAMSGIIQGLEESLPRSYIYVFTDASAKDYHRFEEVKRIAQRKQSQVVFVLTGKCEASESSPKNKVYQDIATVTEGKIFNIAKGEIDKVLEYVKKTITGRRTTLVNTELQGPGSHKITFDTDALMGEVLLSFASGHSNNPNVNIKGPDGKYVTQSVVLHTANVKVYSVNVTQIGTHTVEVDTKAKTQAVISALSGVDFEHGFSVYKLSSIVGTSGTPAPGVKSYLSVKLDRGDIEFKKILILDMDDKEMMEIPLQMTNNETKFYTTEAFYPPEKMFTIAIVGFDPKSKSNITRKAPTPVETPKIKTGEEIAKLAASVVFVGEAEVIANYEEQLELVCKVKGYPKPNVVWINKNNGAVVSNETVPGEIFPYDYINILHLNAIENATYSCEASNSLGSNSKYVTVEVIRKRHLNITSAAENVTVVHNKEGQIACTVDAYPPAEITWYKDDKELAPDAHIELKTTFNNSIVTIKNSTMTDNGKYTCEARNEDTKQSVNVNVKITVPAAIKTPSLKDLMKNVMVGTRQSLRCEASGIPQPELKWIYEGFNASEPPREIKFDGDQTRLRLRNVKIKDEGNYTCTASNLGGSRNITYSVHVFEAPVIEDPNKTKVFVERGSSANLECKILKGRPKPSITWAFKLVKGKQDSPEKFNEVAEWKDKENIVVENVDKNNSGIYKCRAENEINGKLMKDSLDTELFVEYPPQILNKEKEKKFKRANVGSTVSMSCIVDGSPEPHVTWLKDGFELVNDGKPYTFKNYYLRFVAEISQQGNYTCNAANSLGSDFKSLKVDVTEPATIIEMSENRTFLEKVGSNVILPCKTKGYPKPVIKWTYQAFSAPESSDDALEYNTTDNSLHLNNIQEPAQGKYTCTANNIGGIKDVTYKVHVFAPPGIENLYKENRFVAVEGDLALQIDCRTTGNPQPSITWRKGDFNLTLGSVYSVKNGTLTIANIPEDASGVYTCLAENPMGTKQADYEVVVEKYPIATTPASTTLIERDHPAEIKCPLPHEPTDLLRWYKNEELINTGELSIKRTSVRHSGYYTCRVSTQKRSHSSSVKVTVGYSPTFSTVEDVKVDMVEGLPISLICDADGKPEGDVKWYHNGKELDDKEASLYFPTGLTRPGEYKCEVKNKFGNISRTFIAKTQNYCVVKKSSLIKTNNLSPLLLNSNLTWLGSKNSNDIIEIPKDYQVIWFCPSRFNRFTGKNVVSFCVGKNEFRMNGEIHDYADIMCTEEVLHVVKRTGKKCLSMTDDTERVIVGYQVLPNLTAVAYEICLNTTSEIPIYAKHTMQKSFANDKYEFNWADENQFEMNFKEAYDHSTQITTISTSLGSWFHNNDKCNFHKRQLVNPRDVFPGVPQKSTFSYYNVVPHWSSCQTENWDEIENRVRNLVRTSSRDLIVWTGTAKELSIETGSGTQVIYIYGEKQPVPLYLWKVIQDPFSKSSLAIVQVNVPDLHHSKIPRYVICNNLCDTTGWMANLAWSDVTKGYTYCCSLESFENATGFIGVFEPNMMSLLKSPA